MKMQIPINGISTSSDYKDGDTMSLVNLRKKTGVLEPVPPRATLKTLHDTFSSVFVHQLPGGDKNWIGVKGNSIYWIDSGKIGEVAGLTSIQQTGNVLTFIAKNDLYYAIFKDNDYQFLGKLPELPQINIATEQDGLAASQAFSSSGSASGFTEKVKEALDIALKNKFENDLPRPGYKGYSLHDAHFFMMALRAYDGTHIQQSSPILILPPYPILEGKRIAYEQNRVGAEINGSVYVKAYFINLFYEDNIFNGEIPAYLKNWEGVIQSLDFFLSPPVGISQVEMVNFTYPPSSGIHEINAISTYKESALESIRDTSNFYLIRSIPLINDSLSDFYGIFPYDKDKDNNIIINLTQQDRLEESVFSRHSWGSEKSYIYNSRLHLADINNVIFDGYKPRNIALYWGDREGGGDKTYNGNSWPWGDDDYPLKIAVEVQLKLSDGLVSVWSYSDIITDNKFVWLGSPYFFYPDSRAVKAIFYVYRAGQSQYEKMREVDLKRHMFLNGAYYLNPTFSPIETSAGLIPSDVQPENERPVITKDANKLKVSEVNNPFFFPNINTYTIGTGFIRNICSNAMRISEGQFGQFPLYIFTTENIYALNVGDGDVLYATQSPVSNETPVSDVICQTPYGVVFIGKRGLYVINGQNVELLTPFLETHPDDITLSLPTVEKAPNVGNLKTWNDNFLEYLSDVSEIAYDSKESEIILLNTTKEYSFVFNIPSKMWYQQTEDVDFFVKNVHPELYGIKNTNVKDFSQPQTTKVNEVDVIGKTAISFITRPINFGSMEYKTIEQLILRARFRGEYIMFLTNTSRDGLNFDLDKGMSLKKGNYKDINIGRFIKKYRNIIVMFTAEVEADAKIYLIDANVDGSYIKMM